MKTIKQAIRRAKIKLSKGRLACYLCMNKYIGLIDRKQCNFCKKYFCAKHMLPENHMCKGYRRKPEGWGFREIHTKEGVFVKGK